MSLVDVETPIKKVDVKGGILFMGMYAYNEPLLLCSLSLRFSFVPPLLRDSYILSRPSFIIWALHLLIIQTPT